MLKDISKVCGLFHICLMWLFRLCCLHSSWRKGRYWRCLQTAWLIL